VAHVSGQRSGYMTISSRGLDFNSIPMRLFQKAKKLGTWDPWDIDLSRDQADWAALAEHRRDGLISLSTLFQAGEEAVTLDILPLVIWVARQGRLEDEIYLTSFLWEEAKHTEFFRRWLSTVATVDYDLHEYLSSPYRQIFFEELPTTMSRLLYDDSREALARALVTYNIIVEGVLAETGYYSYSRARARDQSMPGLAQGIQLIARDESRHIRFGIYMLQLLVSEDPNVWDTIQARMQELLPLAIGVAIGNRQRFEEKYGPDALVIPPGEIETYAQTQFERRMRALERARRQSPAELTQEVAEEIEQEEQAASHSQTAI
jgi:ribonucleoside-diphosphate reductase beta chain